ncbi:hypothetical protein O181_114762 [Austropuccinia psidii MF-1]|uniref:Integrase catalytic domain-containing protein n=1 Tax=Austropuccinia psidii MF-1 TaxID=1389203 RepID=A0A9Q3PWP4_9BASI|nr:hypothetical protein [Austropuccinia psidii MF-1]
MKTVISNNGGDFVNSKFQDLLSIKGILHQLTEPYTPQQSPISEQGNHTLFEKSQGNAAGLSGSFRMVGEACTMATCILNRTPSSLISFKAPICRQSSLSSASLWMLGYYAHSKGKVNPQGVLYMLVGLTQTHNSYFLFNPLAKRTYYKNTTSLNHLNYFNVPMSLNLLNNTNVSQLPPNFFLTVYCL